MTILFYGDPHGHFQNLFDVVSKTKAEAVVLLGDLGLTASLEETVAPILNKTELWFIHGNHDTDTDTDKDYDFTFGGALSHRNLHGKVVEIAGLRVAGLGGIFRGKVWHPGLGGNNGEPKWAKRQTYMRSQPAVIRRNVERYSGLPRQHHSSIWYEDVDFLKQQQADILVAHEAPSCHPHGFEVLDNLAFAMSVKRLFHGHHHEHYQDEIGNAGRIIIVDGVGMAQCKNEQGMTV